MDLRDVSPKTLGVLLHATSDAGPIHPRIVTSKDDSAEVRVLDGSLKLQPACILHRSGLPAAIPDCLEHVSG